MTLEDRIKIALGEHVFTIIVLSAKLEDAQAKMSEMQKNSKTESQDEN